MSVSILSLDVAANAAPRVDARPTLYLVTDDTDPASGSLTRLVPVLRADVAGRRFATFAMALGDTPASRDVSATVARRRARGAAPLDLTPSELTPGPIQASLPIASLRRPDETTRRIERAALGIAAVIIGMIVLRAGMGL